MIDRARLGHTDQVALVVHRPAIDVRVLRGIHVRIHPRRGLDVGAAWFDGLPLAWISPAGEGGADAADWRAAWGGGLVTTCGLDNVGRASEGVGLHGTYTFLAARDVATSASEREIVVTGIVDEPRGLRVERRIATRVSHGRLELVDRTANLASGALEAPVLYHVNLGWPLWDDGAHVDTDATAVTPRDSDAEAGPWREARRPRNGPERVYEHVGASAAAVVNERLGLRVRVDSNLPRLWQWVDERPNYYAFALEPANCSVLGRAHDRADGRLPLLQPGEERETRVTITAEPT